LTDEPLNDTSENLGDRDHQSISLSDEPLDGYLGKLRRNIQALDEAIESTRKAPDGEKVAERRARLKLLRDLIELENVTLTGVKSHLLGRDETGAPGEPVGTWDHNAQVMFERSFHSFLMPWTLDLLKLKCQDCGIESEEVSHHDFQEIRDSHYNTIVRAEDADLCPQCVEKRNAARLAKGRCEGGLIQPVSRGDVGALLQGARLIVRTLKTLPAEQRIGELERLLADKPQIAPGMESAYETYRSLLQKELDDMKAEA